MRVDPVMSIQTDRRRSPRQETKSTAWISAEAGTGGSNFQVNVSDLSLHGVGFSTKVPMEIEAIHWMVLDAGGLRASSRIRIATCRPEENGSFTCGAEFF